VDGGSQTAGARLKRVVTIYNPNTAPYYPLYMRTIEQAAPSFAVEPIGVEVHDDAEIERAISAVAHEAGGGLIVLPSLPHFGHSSARFGGV
jgi:putative ABC transport system substrate-binding protein